MNKNLNQWKLPNIFKAKSGKKKHKTKKVIALPTDADFITTHKEYSSDDETKNNSNSSDFAQKRNQTQRSIDAPTTNKLLFEQHFATIRGRNESTNSISSMESFEYVRSMDREREREHSYSHSTAVRQWDTESMSLNLRERIDSDYISNQPSPLPPPSADNNIIGDSLPIPQISVNIEVLDPLTDQSLKNWSVRELQQHIDALYNDNLQLQMKNEQLRSNHQKVLKAQQKQLSIAHSREVESQQKLSEAQQELEKGEAKMARIKSDNSRLRQKLTESYLLTTNISSDDHENDAGSGISGHSSLFCSPCNENATEDVLVKKKSARKKKVIYVCKHCGNQLFTPQKLMEQIQISEGDENIACLVKQIEDNDITLGPRVCKRFLSGVFSVNEVFCEGCLNSIGWKIIEAFEKWHSFRQGKFCIPTENIKQVKLL